MVGSYHEAQLARLLEHVREGYAAYDAGQIDAFDMDDTIHRYEQAARKLRSFCEGSGSDVEFAARTLELWKSEGYERDWWEEGAPRRQR